MLVYFPRLGISEIRDLFFRGPIWTILIWKISAVFSLGRCRGRRTSRQDRTSTHVCDASVPRCRGLLFAAVPASSVFVVVQSALGVIRIRTRYNGSSFSSFFPLFLFFISAGSWQKIQGTRGKNIVCCCLVYYYDWISFFLAFLSLPKQRVCTRAAWWLYCVNEAAYYLK